MNELMCDDEPGCEARNETIEMQLRRDAGGSWTFYGDEVVVLGGEFGWVFDSVDFRAALRSPIGDDEDGWEVVCSLCADLSDDPVRGKRARQAHVCDFDGEGYRFA